MVRTTTVLLLLSLAVMYGGCGKSSGTPASASLSSEAKLFCLAGPDGSTKLDQQIRLLQQRAKSIPGNADNWIFLARHWIRKARTSGDPGFYRNVDGCSSIALRLDPHNSAALGLRAIVSLNNHEFLKANEVAGRILKNANDDLIALGVKSDALVELGQYQEAIETTQQMLDIRPDMASYSRASYLRWLHGDAASAKALLHQALEGRDVRDPEPAAWTFVQAAILFWNEGDYEGAIALCDEALRWVPDYAPALSAKGRAFLSLNQPEQAIPLLQKAYQLNPLPETAWLLGDALAMQGDNTSAEMEYEKVIVEGKKSDRLTLALFYSVKRKNLDRALELIEQERAVRGGVYVDDTYAWVLYRLGRIPQAQVASERALALGTEDSRLLYHAGAIRLAAGDQSGRTMLQKALRLNPQFDFTGAAEAQSLLNRYAKN